MGGGTLCEDENLERNMAVEREDEVKEKTLGCSILREVFESTLTGLCDSKASSIDALQM